MIRKRLVDPLLTPTEVAQQFGVATSTIRRWAKTGRLACVRTPGNHRRYRESEIRALLKATP